MLQCQFGPFQCTNSSDLTFRFARFQIKKETLVQVFSCEFCEIFKNTFFTEHLRTTASTSNKDSLSFRKNALCKNVWLIILKVFYIFIFFNRQKHYF